MLTQTRNPKDVRLQTALHKRASELRKRSTETEKTIWTHLKSRKLAGLKFRRQWPIDRYIVDFYCAAKKLVVEVDGGYHQDRIQYDKERDARLKALGYRVLRFNNDQVINDLSNVLQTIKNSLS